MTPAELRERRLGLGLTQSELATRLGVARNTVARWERAELTMARPEVIELVLGSLSPSRREPQAFASPAPGLIGDLHTQLTSFVGRERDISVVERLIETSRLTTLTGAGGIGKTRLALHVVDGLERTNVGDIVIVELATLSSPALVPEAVAAALGLGRQAQPLWVHRLVEVLQTRRVLLVLDNCEHLVEACAKLADALLRSCPELRIVATSREPLGIGGETVWRVPSLSTPGALAHYAPEQLVRSESVRLFCERARAVLPDFAVTNGNAAALARLCRRLDGIPLALELAAARVPVLSVEQLANRLDDALHVLNTGSRVAPPRQQTLRATLEWSCRLLSKHERALFPRLSVFAGGWTLEAAEAICVGDGIQPEELLELLARLVDKSLVLSEVRGAGPTRYRLLETVRQLGSELLKAGDETERLRDRHLRWFVSQAERAEAKPYAWHRWFPWFFEELDNLRSALDWAIERRDVGPGLRLGAALHPFWLNTIYAPEGRTTLEALLGLPDGVAYTGARAKCLVAEGNLIRFCGGDLRVARSVAERGLALAREIGDARLLHDGLRLAGSICGFQHDEEAATNLLLESLKLARDQGDGWEWEIGVSLALLGNLRRFLGQHAQARPLVEEAIERLRAVGDQLILHHALGWLADIALSEDRSHEARRCARESLELDAAMGVFPDAALTVLARLAAAEGQCEHAVRLAGAVSVMRPQSGMTGTLDRSQVVDRVWRELGAARAAAVWAEGEAMSIDEATAYALSEVFGEPRSNPRAKGLTRREMEVLRLVAEGTSNREIASMLVLSTRTVERHIQNVYAKIGANSRASATVYALRHSPSWPVLPTT